MARLFLLASLSVTIWYGLRTRNLAIQAFEQLDLEKERARQASVEKAEVRQVSSKLEYSVF